MEIQSLSVCVPAGCPNQCKFCVSRMHPAPYPNQIEKNVRQRDLYERDFVRRLQFARDNGCNTAILTGDGEPLANRDFLKDFAHWNQMSGSPFRWIELQTSGVLLDEACRAFLRHTVGVCTLSLSLSDLFDSDENARINGTPEPMRVDVERLCADLKQDDFNLRLSLNMTDNYERRLGTGLDAVGQILERAQRFGANQVTFRQLYLSGDPSLPQNQWIREHAASAKLMGQVGAYVRERGRPLEKLPFGAMRYSVQGLSVVVDDDCMSTEAKPVMKYLVLRPDCKLYTKWDDPGSLLF